MKKTGGSARLLSVENCLEILHVFLFVCKYQTAKENRRYAGGSVIPKVRTT